jgi:hypothetical protein
MINNIIYMEKYYIYHIEGVKIGCSKNPKNRVKSQGYDTFIILEEHTDAFLAGERERELQRQFGYKVDKFNYKIVSKKTDEERKRLSDIKKGTKQSTETKNKRAVALKGNKNALGKTHSDEIKKKTSERLKEEYKNGRTKGMLGKKMSLETKEKMSKSRTGKKSPLKGSQIPDDRKKKISDTQNKKPYCVYEGEVYSCLGISEKLKLTKRQVVNIKYTHKNNNKYNITFI